MKEKDVNIATTYIVQEVAWTKIGNGLFSRKRFKTTGRMKIEPISENVVKINGRLVFVLTDEQFDALIPKPKISRRFKCLLCGRDKFTQRQPHNCIGGFRKRKIKWQEVGE